MASQMDGHDDEVVLLDSDDEPPNAPASSEPSHWVSSKILSVIKPHLQPQFRSTHKVTKDDDIEVIKIKKKRSTTTIKKRVTVALPPDVEKTLVEAVRNSSDAMKRLSLPVKLDPGCLSRLNGKKTRVLGASLMLDQHTKESILKKAGLKPQKDSKNGPKLETDLQNGTETVEKDKYIQKDVEDGIVDVEKSNSLDKPPTSDIVKNVAKMGPTTSPRQLINSLKAVRINNKRARKFASLTEKPTTFAPSSKPHENARDLSASLKATRLPPQPRSQSPSQTIKKPPSAKNSNGFLKKVLADHEEKKKSLEVFDFRDSGDEEATRVKPRKRKMSPDILQNQNAKKPMQKVEEIKVPVAKKSASIVPKPNLAMPEFCQKLIQSTSLKIVNENCFVATNLFRSIYDDFSVDIMALINSGSYEASKHLLFDGWSVTHVSVALAKDIVAEMGKKPRDLFNFFHDLITNPSLIVLNMDQESSPAKEKCLSDLGPTEFGAVVGLVASKKPLEKRNRILKTRSKYFVRNCKVRNKSAERKSRALCKGKIRPAFRDRKFMSAVGHTNKMKKIIKMKKLKKSIQNVEEQKLLEVGQQAEEKMASSEQTCTPTQNLNGENKTEQNGPSEKRKRRVSLENKTIIYETFQMRKQGVTLPEGWFIYNKKTDQAQRANPSYVYNSPCGKRFTSLKSVIDFMAQNGSAPPSPSIKTFENDSNGEEKVEVESVKITNDEMTRFKPCRKFASNHVFQKAEKPQNEILPPSTTKKKKKRGRINESEGAFSLSHIKVPGNLHHEGWFTAKLQLMKHLAKPNRDQHWSKNIDSAKTAAKLKTTKTSVKYSEGLDAMLDLEDWKVLQEKKKIANSIIAPPAKVVSCSDDLLMSRAGKFQETGPPFPPCIYKKTSLEDGDMKVEFVNRGGEKYSSLRKAVANASHCNQTLL